MRGRYPFEKSDIIRVSIRASVTAANTLWVRVQYTDGTWETIPIPCTHAGGDRANELFYAPKPFSKPGEVVLAAFEVGGTVRRGQIYAMAQIGLGGADPHPAFMTGYATTPNHLGVGQFEDSLSGRGYQFIETIVQDANGNVVTTYTLGVANAQRIIHGIITYINADGNSASRGPTFHLRSAWGDLPTGFVGTGAMRTWQSTGPTAITATQEGNYWVVDDFASENDNGAQTLHDQSSEPNPFPIFVPEGLTDMQIDCSITGGLAGDKYSSYALVEEWIVE